MSRDILSKDVFDHQIEVDVELIEYDDSNSWESWSLKKIVMMMMMMMVMIMMMMVRVGVVRVMVMLVTHGSGLPGGLCRIIHSRPPHRSPTPVQRPTVCLTQYHTAPSSTTQ